MVSALHALLGWTGWVCSAALALGLASDLVTRAASVEEAVDVVASDAPGQAAALAANPDHAAGSPHRSGAVTLRRVYRVTAYCDLGITASGRAVGVGQCAAPADIPFGARVYIPALGRSFTVTDRTHRRFRHNTVDIFMPSRTSCLQFGRKYLECVITLPEAPAARARG